MDSFSVVVTALANGAVVRETASSAVKSAYVRLRRALVERFEGRDLDVGLFEEIERIPEEADVLVLGLLRKHQDVIDREIFELADRLSDALDESDARPGRYHVNVRDVRGVQIGDHNLQVNTFSTGNIQFEGE